MPTKRQAAKTPRRGDRRQEEIFAIYRDMGPSRSYPKLQEAIKDRWGAIHVRTFSTWAKAFNWATRIAEYDAQQAALPAAAPASQIAAPMVDTVEALMQTATRALEIAMKAAPRVARVSDVKSLIDAATNAMKLAESVQAKRQVQQDDDAARAEMWSIIHTYEAAISDRDRRIKFMRLLAKSKGIDIDMREVERLVQAEIREEEEKDERARQQNLSADLPLGEADAGSSRGAEAARAVPRVRLDTQVYPGLKLRILSFPQRAAHTALQAFDLLQ
jgi:hypothetical protein